MKVNYVKLFQDARIETIEIIAKGEMYIIYSEDLDKQEQFDLAYNYDVKFINDRCCIIEFCNETW